MSFALLNILTLAAGQTLCLELVNITPISIVRNVSLHVVSEMAFSDLKLHDKECLFYISAIMTLVEW